MKYVYVLMCGCVGDYHIHDILSSDKKANEKEDKLKKDKRSHGEVWVEKWEVK